MTPDFFREQMHRMSGLRFMPANFETHWEALSELPEAVLDAAVTRAQKTRVDFPTPVELRIDADRVAVREPEPDEADRKTPLETPREFDYPLAGRTIRVTDEWRYYCSECSDLGWQSVWCGDIKAPSRMPWHEPRTCARKEVHGDHEWVRPCACVESNPALRRKREAQQKYANEAQKKAS